MALWLTIDFSYVHSLHVWEGKVQMLKLRKRSLYSSSGKWVESDEILLTLISVLVNLESSVIISLLILILRYMFVPEILKTFFHIWKVECFVVIRQECQEACAEVLW